jgi:hypothetical protein
MKATPHAKHQVFHNESLSFDIDSAMKKFSQPPNDVASFFLFRFAFLHSVDEYVEPIDVKPHLPAFLYIQRQDKDCFCRYQASPFFLLPVSDSTDVNRACWLLTRRRKAGRHDRRPVLSASSPFFPRSVGLGPTDSIASGALFVLPSILCHNQAMPSISSYSTSPAFHIRSNTPARDHSMKYRWIAVPTPNSDFGNALHCIPVRATYTIPSNIFRFGIRGRPAPSERLYFLLGSRVRSGISGSTFSQNVSDIVQDLYRYGVLFGFWTRRLTRVFCCVIH